jgi:hypothetical protein
MENKDFETMVETLEENEDIVECQECFELFPKADCAKIDHGYICPTCGRARPRDLSEISTSDITVDLFDQDFPDAMEYDPEIAPRVAERTADFRGMFDALLKDEFDAIDGYDVAIEAADHSDLENRDEVIDTLDHIKAEEEEHIDEIRDLQSEATDSEEAKDTEDAEETPAETEDKRKILDEDITPELWIAEDIDNGELIAACYATSEDEAYEILSRAFGERTGKWGSEQEDCHVIKADEVDVDMVDDDILVESVLTEANFFTNLFTKENQNLDQFFAKGYKVVVGGSTTPINTGWADAEKFAIQKSKANPAESVSVSAVAVPADELKNSGWSQQLVTEFGGKDFVIATYRNGKATLVDKASALAKRLKAEIKSNKIMNKSGTSSTNYSDQYDRKSITGEFTPSKVEPAAATIVKLTNILFSKYTALQGMAHPATEEAKASGSDIQIAEVKSLGEFEVLADAVKAAAGNSSRVPVEGSGDAPVVEVYGYFKDFDEKILEYLEKMVTRSELGALEEAKSAGGPVHLFTYSRGKAIVDKGCASLSQFVKMEANILQDLGEAGYDVSGKPGAETPKNKTDEPETADDDLDLEDEAEEPTDPKSKLKAVLGEKKEATGYTAESYAKYEALYEKIIAWIEGLKKPEAVADSKIEAYKATAEGKLVVDPNAEDADLDLEDGEATPEDGETADETSEEGTDAEDEEGSDADDSETPGTAAYNKKYHGAAVTNTSIQAFRKLMMLAGMKVYDAMGAEVTADLAGAKKITAETLNDFEVEVQGERQPLTAWLAKMVKVGALHENFGRSFGVYLTEADRTAEKDHLKDKGITDSALSSFKKLFALTDLKVYDAFDKPVPTSKEGMAQMTSLTLVDFTVEYKGKKVPLIQFVAKLAKEKVLKENLLKEICDLV